jgi:hypothetical protein
MMEQGLQFFLTPKSTSYVVSAINLVTLGKLQIRVFLFNIFEPKLKIHGINNTRHAKDQIDYKIIFYIS